jgi:hypothetical protein
MCCFAGHVSDVSGTNIFARVDGDREYLVYEMTFTSQEQTAMILPIPVAPGRPEDVVKFVALDAYPDFFGDLERHFTQVWARAKLLGAASPRVGLKVHLVGAFEASFVPRLELFDRLDARFRIQRRVWEQLPAYESFGFVVFKLRPGQRVTAHPMAFSFQTREPRTVFFPTVHIHDQSVHDTAAFDHILYIQNQPTRGGSWPGTLWMSDDTQASEYVDVVRTRGVVDGEARCLQMAVVGTFRNSDVVIPIEVV